VTVPARARWTSASTPLQSDADTYITHQWLSLRGGNMDSILGLSRRSVLATGLAVSASWLVGRSQAQTPESVMTRPIPHSGEQLPIVGLGTAVSFPSANESQRARLKDVIDALVAGGGKLIDTASVYGNAESVIGDIVRTSNVRNKIFIATKIEVRSAKAGADEFQRSLQRLRTEKVDLLQLHNVSRPSQSLSQLRDWKAAGRCGYVGITSTDSEDYNAMEAIIRREKPDFVQVDYSMDNRAAEKRILSQVLRLMPSLSHGRTRDSDCARYSVRGLTPASRRLCSLASRARRFRMMVLARLPTS
jgi:Aldo/keto reductase family